MHLRARTPTLASAVVLVVLSVHPQIAAQAPTSVLDLVLPAHRLGSYYPSQLPAGETTMLHVAASPLAEIQAIEITPPAGVSVSILGHRNIEQGAVWWEFSVAVSRDAAPGPRTLVAVLPTGRTSPITVTVPNKVPRIRDVRLSAGQVGQPIEANVMTPDLRSFGVSPYVWFTLACNSAPKIFGVVRGTTTDDAIRASIPTFVAGPNRTDVTSKPCALQLRVTDSSGVDSNTIAAAVVLK